MKKILLFLSFLLISIFAYSTTYKLTQVSSLSSGNKYVFKEGSNILTGTINNGIVQSVTSYSESNLLGTELYVWEIETAPNGFFIKNCNTEKYINNTGSSTNINESSTAISNWTFSYQNGYFLIQNYSNNNRFIGKQTSGTGYKAYATSNLSTYSHNFVIYKLVEEAQETYTISFINKNDETIISKTVNNGNYTIEETVDDYKMWQFSGWSTDSTDFSKIVSEINVSKNIELYAFFKYGNEGYVLVEEELDDWSGEYLIVNHDSLVAFNGSLTTLDVVEDTIHVDIINKIINSTTKNNISSFTIKSKSDGYSIKSKSGYYIGWESNNNNGLSTSNSDTYTNTISYNGSFIDINGSGGAYLRYNASSNQNRFRFYKSSSYTDQKPIQLYKRTLANLYCTNPSNIKMIEWLEDSIKLDINNYDSVNVNNTWELLTKEQDGTYKIYVDNLTNKSCTDLVIKTKKDGRTDCINVFKIPIFITGNADNSTINNSDSASCDLVILKNGKLTLTDNLESRDIIVYPSGTLNIPSGKEYKVNSLTLRKDNDSVPQLSYNGPLTIQNDFNIELRMDANNWYWTSLPFEFKPSMLKKSNGETPLLDDEYYIEYYDGANRAHNQTKSFRYLTTDSTFKAGQGFAIHLGTDHTGKHIYTIPFNKDSLSHELNTSKTILGLHAWQGGNVNDRGWNLIGNPYMNEIALDEKNIRTDTLTKVIENGQWNGHWELAGANEVRYIVVRNSNGTYSYQLIGDGYYIKPFTSFFVQLAGNNENEMGVSFVKANQKSNIVARKNISTHNDEIFLRIGVENYKTGCFISDDYTDEYEIGYDLSPFENDNSVKLYQYINGYKLLYSAINDSIIEHGIKVYTPAGNLHLDDKTNIEDFDEIYAFYNDEWIDLLHGQTQDVSGEFILFAKRKTQVDIPTDIDIIKDNNEVIKFMHNNNLYIKKNNHIYNILGGIIK